VEGSSGNMSLWAGYATLTTAWRPSTAVDDRDVEIGMEVTDISSPACSASQRYLEHGHSGGGQACVGVDANRQLIPSKES
jgi:hypothetical protein